MDGRDKPGHDENSSRLVGLLVAVDALAALVALLGFDTQGGDRPGIEALQADRLAGFLAKAVGAIVKADKGGVDLGNQLALAVAGAKLERPLGLGARPVGDVGVLRRFVLKVLERLLGRTENFLAPDQQLPPDPRLPEADSWPWHVPVGPWR